MSDRSKWLQGLRELPEGNHFIEVTFRNVRTGKSYLGQVYVLTPELYKWIGGRHPQPDTPEQALACLLEIAINNGVRPPSGSKRNQAHALVYYRFQTAFLLGERGDKLTATKGRLLQDYLTKLLGSPRADGRWTRERQNLDKKLRNWLKSEFESDFPDAFHGKSLSQTNRSPL